MGIYNVVHISKLQILLARVHKNIPYGRILGHISVDFLCIDELNVQWTTLS